MGSGTSDFRVTAQSSSLTRETIPWKLQKTYGQERSLSRKARHHSPGQTRNLFTLCYLPGSSRKGCSLLTSMHRLLPNNLCWAEGTAPTPQSLVILTVVYPQSRMTQAPCWLPNNQWQAGSKSPPFCWGILDSSAGFKPKMVLGIQDILPECSSEPSCLTLTTLQRFIPLSQG